MPDFGRWSANGGDPSLNEINRTDRFLDALAPQRPVYSTDPGEAELAQLLAGWRDDVRTPPLMSPVTPRDASVALRRALDARKRTRTSMAVVGSVAAVVLCLGGFGAVVAGAGPGDALYGLHTTLFGEQKQTRGDAVMLASQQLAEVQQLIDKGQWDAAQNKLQTLTTTVATVNDVQQKQQLVTQWQDLTVKVDAKDPNATLPPGVPPPVMPEPAVVAPGSDTSTTTSSVTSSSTSTSSSSETATSSSETTSSPTTSSPTTSSPTSSSPVSEPPPTSGTPTTTPPPTTPTPPTTTTPHAITTTTTSLAGVPAAGGGGAEVVAPPTSVSEAPRQAVTPPPPAPSEAPKQRGPESPVTQSPVTQSPVTQSPVTQNPVTTTTLVMPPPKKHGD